MRSFIYTLAALIALAVVPGAAKAHFIWATVSDGQVRFALLEHADEAPDAKFEKYVADLTPRAGEVALTLGAAKDGARFAPLRPGQDVAYADSTVGAKERDGVSYLLVYHAKGAATPAAAAAGTAAPVELRARREGESLIVSVHQGQWPVPQSEVWVQWPGEEEPEPLKTDVKGEVKTAWPKSPRAGFASLRAMVTEKKAGENAGKKYTEIHHWATLTFPIEGLKADTAAWTLLKEAHDSRQTFGAAFPGLSADLVVDDNGTIRTGKVTYNRESGVTVSVDGAGTEAREWADGMLSNLLGHRRGGDFARGDGRHPITFSPEDRSPLGRKVVLNDSLRSEYRVKNRTVTEVTRTMGDTRFTITMLAFEEADGKYLPQHFTVTYFDAATGAIRRSEAFSDRHEKIGGYWMPVARRVITAEKGAFVTRSVELKNVRISPAREAHQTK